MYLEKLKNLIISNENLLYEAIYNDFGKSKFDTFTTEISFVLHDIDYYLKHLHSLAKPKKQVLTWLISLEKVKFMLNH